MPSFRKQNVNPDVNNKNPSDQEDLVFQVASYPVWRESVCFLVVFMSEFQKLSECFLYGL